MIILFIHQNFPAQFKHLAPALVKQGHQVFAIGMSNHVDLPGVQYFRYRSNRGSTKGIHPWIVDFEAKTIRAEACVLLAQKLKLNGFNPDLIFVHPGWGEALLLREVWPNTKQLHYIEFFYDAVGQDVGFDPEFGSVDFASRCRIQLKNTNNLLNLRLMDRGVSPTHWQKSTVPKDFHSKIEVIHDGIDSPYLAPDNNVRFAGLDVDGNALDFSRHDEIITFVNRNLEPCRGYHIFMRSLPKLLSLRPNAHVLIIGGDSVSYGAPPESGSWKIKFFDEVSRDIDVSRVHFLGKVSYSVYLKIMRLSRAHVYLTYPFVLSWSLLEAMSLGAPVIASDTAPVAEVIEHGKNGWLFDFFDHDALASQVHECLSNQELTTTVACNARDFIVRNYDLKNVILPKQISLINDFLVS